MEEWSVIIDDGSTYYVKAHEEDCAVYEAFELYAIQKGIDCCKGEFERFKVKVCLAKRESA